MQRRQFMQSAGVLLASASLGCAAIRSGAKPQVLIIGAGFAGATAAKYVRLWSRGQIDVTLLEPNCAFVSGPISNLVLGGSRQMADITLSYTHLVQTHGVRWIRERAERIDAEQRTVHLANGSVLGYDRLILAPGIDFIWDALPATQRANAPSTILHAWKAGPQTLALRQQLEAMPDGGQFVLSIPELPYRCPPAPYERACQVAHYFSRYKPKSRVVVLDANDDITSKGALFKQAFATRYPNLIEYRPQFKVAEVDSARNTLISEFGDQVPGAVVNWIPPQRAANIASQAGLANINQRWCEVDFLSYESTRARHIYVLGDAIQVAPQMAKSGHMANQQAKVCAAALINSLGNKPINLHPVLTNSCYSFVSAQDAIHLASEHVYHAQQKTMLGVPKASILSGSASQQEGVNALNWAKNIWQDALM